MAAVPLSPIDHVFTGVGSYPIEFAFAYAGALDADRLQVSFEETLSHFPVVQCQLARVSDHSYEFHRTGDGPTFETAATAESFADAQARHIFLDSVDSVEGQPLTRIKLTQTPEGSVLGVSMSHALVDGFSYFYFLSSWARIYHGKDIHAPSHERQRLMPTQLPWERRIAVDDVRAACGVFWDERRAAMGKEDLRWDRFCFSKEEIKELLAEAREDCEGRLSFNDVIAAWLWKHYQGARGSRGGVTYLSCPVDFRRIVRSFPKTYFGCAVTLTTAALERDALADASIGMLAAKVREAVAEVGEEYVIKGLGVLEALRRQEGLSVIEHCHVIHPRDGILVTNLSRLPIYDLAFDEGPPVAFDVLTSAPAGAVVLPAAGGLDIRVCRSSGAVGSTGA